jgi:putative transposase
MDETFVRVKGAWKYLYRAADKDDATSGLPVDRQTRPQGTLRFLRKEIGQNGTPEKMRLQPSTFPVGNWRPDSRIVATQAA